MANKNYNAANIVIDTLKIMVWNIYLVFQVQN